MRSSRTQLACLLFLCGCESNPWDPSSSVRPVEIEWAPVGEGAFAAGHTVSLDAEIRFEVDADASAEENCGVRSYELSLEGEGSASVEDSWLSTVEPTLATLDWGCILEVTVQIGINSDSNAGSVELLYEPTRQSKTVRFLTGTPSSVELASSGYQSLRVLEGQPMVVDARVFSEDGRRLRGLPMMAALEPEGFAELYPWPTSPAWIVAPPSAGKGTIAVSDGLDAEHSDVIEVVSAEEILGLRFFQVEASPAVEGDLWPFALDWSEFDSDLESLVVDRPISVIAAPVDDTGQPIWAGPDIRYEVELFGAVHAIPVSMRRTNFDFDREGSVLRAGTEWLDLDPMSEGTTTITARWGEYEDTLTLVVTD